MKRRPSRCAREGCGDTLRKHTRTVTVVYDSANEDTYTNACSEGWAYSESAGWYVLPDTVECRCEGFLSEAAPTSATRKKRGSHRSIRAEGIRAQRTSALLAGFQPREGHGSDSLYYSPDGAALLVGESKHAAQFPWGEVEKAMQQAESYARTERGRPLGAVLHTTKPGSGKTARVYLVLRAEDWPNIVGRLAGSAP